MSQKSLRMHFLLNAKPNIAKSTDFQSNLETTRSTKHFLENIDMLFTFIFPFLQV